MTLLSGRFGLPKGKMFPLRDGEERKSEPREKKRRNARTSTLAKWWHTNEPNMYQTNRLYLTDPV